MEKSIAEEKYFLLRGSFEEHSALIREIGTGTLSRKLQSENPENGPFLILVCVIVALICLFYLVCTVQMLRMWVCRKCCGSAQEDVPDDTLLVHQGQIYNLSGDQRRAVLEAIFSETSKPATEEDVVTKKKRKRKFTEDDDVPFDVEIPGVSTAGTEHSMETPSPSSSQGKAVDLEDVDDAAVSDSTATSRSDYDVLAKTISEDEYDAANVEDDISVMSAASGRSGPSPPPDSSVCGSVAGTPLPAACTPTSLTNTPHQSFEECAVLTPPTCLMSNVAKDFDTPDISNLKPLCRPLPFDIDSPELPTSGCDNEDESDLRLSIPVLTPGPGTTHFPIPEDKAVVDLHGDDNEEAKVEEDQVIARLQEEDEDAWRDAAALYRPIPLSRFESQTTVASEYTYDDESTCTGTGDNVCPICICGYRKDDILIVSKYCTHMFHKDCILEWLEKHDECPVCRVGMVTDSEMSRAATSLVGKTRMYRAVAALSQPVRFNPYIRRPPGSPRNAVRPNASPLGGTVRRVASQQNTGNS